MVVVVVAGSDASCQLSTSPACQDPRSSSETRCSQTASCQLAPSMHRRRRSQPAPFSCWTRGACGVARPSLGEGIALRKALVKRERVVWWEGRIGGGCVSFGSGGLRPGTRRRPLHRLRLICDSWDEELLGAHTAVDRWHSSGSLWSGCGCSQAWTQLLTWQVYGQTTAGRAPSGTKLPVIPTRLGFWRGSFRPEHSSRRA